mmetsp:Transcript_8101/g.21430  ORF Transcript_8101/g.21430 Transcript_8101/m.21430 type:complete len:157 (-) Transcript_8101:378-848(-)
MDVESGRSAGTAQDVSSNGTMLLTAKTYARDERMEIAFLLAPVELSAEAAHREEEVVRRNRWTRDEDALLVELVRKHGALEWKRFESMFPGRRGTHLRSHYKHALEVRSSKRAFSTSEDAFILAEAEKGRRWCEIARNMDRRVDNHVKNRYWQLTR